jgi:hypothetical protein
MHKRIHSACDLQMYITAKVINKGKANDYNHRTEYPKSTLKNQNK